MEEWIIKILERLSVSAPSDVMIILAVYGLFFRPILKRLSGLSSYIKRFLALQQRRARGQEALAKAVSDLTARVMPIERKVRKTDYE